jgi:hypothetical protein
MFTCIEKYTSTSTYTYTYICVCARVCTSIHTVCILYVHMHLHVNLIVFIYSCTIHILHMNSIYIYINVRNCVFTSTYLSMYCTVCAYVCIDGWTHACMYAWRYVFMYCMHECMGAFIHACIHACMYCIHVFLYACVLTSALLAFRGICSCGSDLEGSTSLAIKLHEILQLRLARFHSRLGTWSSCSQRWKAHHVMTPESQAFVGLKSNLFIHIPGFMRSPVSTLFPIRKH